MTSGGDFQIGASASHAITQKADDSEFRSLFDHCSILKSKLLRVRGFAKYFPECDSSNSEALGSTDPVSQLRDIFSSGLPLCYIFNQLPVEAGFGRIVDHRFKWESSENDDERIRVRAIAHFCMSIRGYKIQQQIPGIELFTVTDLWDRNSNKSFSKVVKTASAIVDYLPPQAFRRSLELEPAIPDRNPSIGPSDPVAKRMDRVSFLVNIIKEIVETERNYVNKLKDISTFSDARSQADVMDPNFLFVGMAQLVNVQRKFLALIEETATLNFEDQRWGRCFLECEEEFTGLYVPYCANYPSAKKRLDSMANVKEFSIIDRSFSISDLNMMLVTPVSRICKYPLLLESLLKAYYSSTYLYVNELERGLDASKRLSEKINEAVQRSEKEQTALELSSRVVDWKGFVPTEANFGKLLLDDGSLLVSSSDISQEYSADDDFCVVSRSDVFQTFHVFLFEQIVILCEEELNKLEKGSGSSGSRNCPLTLMGHIFLEDIIRAVPTHSASHLVSKGSFRLPHLDFPLTIWWRGKNTAETSFTLQFKYEQQMHQWQARINTILQGLPALTENPRSRRSSSAHGDSYKNPGTSERPNVSAMGRLYSNISRGTNGKAPTLNSHFSLGNFESIKHRVPVIQSSRTIHSSSGSINRNSKTPLNPHPIQNADQKDETTTPSISPLKVEIKIIFRDDVFLLRLPLTATHEELVAKIYSSSRPNHIPQGSETQALRHPPIWMRYIDEDGDAISLKSSEDVQMFLEQYHSQTCHPRRPIVLLVGI